MRKYLYVILFVVAASATFGILTPPAQAAFNVSDWPRYCAVESGDTTGGYALTEISGSLYEGAFEDLRDVRVAQTTAGKIEEVPYDVVSRSNVPKEIQLTASLMNRGVTGKSSTATVFLGASGLTHNHLKINTGSRDFIKEVTLEGSDDRTTWVKVKNSGKIADFSSSGRVFHQTDITYDSIDYPYLRVTLSAGTGEVVNIDGIEVFFDDIKAGNENYMELRVIDRQVSKKENTSIITMTSGYSNFPLHRVALSAGSTNFSRPAVIYGSADMKAWHQVGEGSLASFSLANYSESQMFLAVNSPGYRYLRVVVRNGDSAPVNFTGARGYYYPKYLLFPCKSGSRYGVYYGNRFVKTPEYDLNSFSVKILDTNPPVWKLSLPQANPLYQVKPKVVPESEKYKWLLPGILAVLVAALAVFIIKAVPKVMKDRD